MLAGADQWQRVGIAVGTVTGLRVGWVGVRIRVGAIFPAPARTGPGAHLASCKWVQVLFPGSKAAGGGMAHFHLAPRLKKELSYTSTPSLRPHGLFEGEFYLHPPQNFQIVYVGQSSFLFNEYRVLSWGKTSGA